METNENYIEEGIRRIGSFCTRMGLQQELDEYRQRAPEFLQRKVDRSHTGIDGRAKLSPARLPEGWLDQILDFILKISTDCIHQIYLVQENEGADYSPSSFVIRFREGTDDRQIDTVYDRVFRLLDDWPVDYEFCLYIYEDGMDSALHRVEGSCVYDREGE